MKTSSPCSTQTRQMPIYNRNNGHNRRTSDGNDDEIQLSNVQKKVFLEREIKSEDTLQSIALEYNISIAELKRVNNIHKDNEIHARKILKIPTNTFSLLLEREYFCKSDTTKAEPDGSSGRSAEVIVETVNRSSCAPRSCSESSNSEDVIFSAKNSKYFFTPIKSSDEAEEGVELLAASKQTLKPTSDALSCSGSDWGLTWPTLLVFVIVLGIGGPLFYLLLQFHKNKTNS